jgi:hypothetical protein
MKTLGLNQSYLIMLTAIILLVSLPTFAQLPLENYRDQTKTLRDTIIDKPSDTIRFWITRGCKFRPDNFTNADLSSLTQPGNSLSRSSFLKVHGTIQYDFTYRSLVDTPFSQKDFAQHSLQASVDFILKDIYPVRVTLLAKRNNSPYFDNITDVNVQFNRNFFLNKIKDDLRQKIPAPLSVDKLAEQEKLFQQKLTEVNNLQGWLNNPARIEEFVEEKERALRNRAGTNLQQLELPGEKDIKAEVTSLAKNDLKKEKDSLLTGVDSLATKKKDVITDSSATSKMERYEQKKQELIKAKEEVKEWEQKLKTAKKTVQDSLNILKQEIAKLNNPESIKAYIKKHDIDPKNLPAGWKTLLNLRTAAIGRSWVDYSELTVKNISLTGINLEVTPSPFYFAVAAGRINYRFRDFVIKNNDAPNQSLWLMRAGLGSKDGNNLILTYYDGKRNLINSFNTTFSSTLERVIGVSIENRVAIDQNNYATLEIAKSSFHNTGSLNQGTNELMKKVWNLKDHSNEAYSIKLNSYFPQSATKITGYFKKMGGNFQSFNLQPVNVRQESYQAKIQQSLFKQKLSLEAAVRKNDFTNPYINPGLNSKTVFKSLQASLRIPKYPFVSIGYYPSSQLTLLDNNILVENQYNTLSGVISHFYRVKRMSMNSSAVYLRFYNHNSDTGFIYYNASSFSISQNIFWRSLQSQSGMTFIHQQNLDVFSWEQSASLQLKNWLTVGSGFKYNKVNHAQTVWGGSVNISFQVKELGTIQLVYDRSYLPGNRQNLLPIDMGRVSFYRSF